jgi:hypothetical protein
MHHRQRTAVSVLDGCRYAGVVLAERLQVHAVTDFAAALSGFGRQHRFQSALQTILSEGLRADRFDAGKNRCLHRCLMRWPPRTRSSTCGPRSAKFTTADRVAPALAGAVRQALAGDDDHATPGQTAV